MTTKHFKDMSPAEVREWRALWKEGKAERWIATLATAGVPKPRETDVEAPTSDLCVQLVQAALKLDPFAWVASSPHELKADDLLRKDSPASSDLIDAMNIATHLEDYADHPLARSPPTQETLDRLAKILRSEAGQVQVINPFASTTKEAFYNRYVEGKIGKRSVYPHEVIKLCLEADALWQEHADCGRGHPDEGPDHSDCAHRGTNRQAECASTGCGFCGVVVRKYKDLTVASFPRHAEDLFVSNPPPLAVKQLTPYTRISLDALDIGTDLVIFDPATLKVTSRIPWACCVECRGVYEKHDPKCSRAAK